MQAVKDKTVRELARECKTPGEVFEKLKEIFKDTLEQMLEAEMDYHLGYPKHDPRGNNTGNSRNGYSKKNIKTKLGNTEINIPRDRNGEFEPQVVRKYQTSLGDIEEQVLAMYAKGMSTRDIEEHLKDIYGIDVSPTLVSK